MVYNKDGFEKVGAKMELQTVSQISKAYGVSTRMLRYYEQNGLIQSQKKPDYAYRVYDEINVKRLEQVIILRKLQIPVKQICIILNNPDATTLVRIFKENIHALNEEMTALSTVKQVLEQFVKNLAETVGLEFNLDFINSDSILESVAPISLVQRNIKERVSMSDVFKASDVLNRLENVRVIYVPPMTVASVFCDSDDSENKAWQLMIDFIEKSDLITTKPDLRVFKIAHQNATGDNFGDEVWVSIPANFEIPTHFTRKQFLGGQYAVHVLDNNGFEVALGLQDWINESDKFQYDFDGNLARVEPPLAELESFGGMHLDLSEVLNFNNFKNASFEMQIDYMTPIKDYILVAEENLVKIPDSKEKCGFKASLVTKNKFNIIGFTHIVTDENPVDKFIHEIKNDGRLDLLNRLKKPNAPILCFESHDLDSQLRGGWRYTVCLLESDVSDVELLKQYQLYCEKIDASKWLVFEYTKKDEFNDHATCPKLGYTWNGIISGSFNVFPTGKIGQPEPNDTVELTSPVYNWYPVK